MCNCGRKRNELKQQAINFNKTSTGIAKPISKEHAPVLFQYTGNTALTVTGRITRKNYRFNFSGDKQFIDHNDANSMMQIPVLKKVT